MSEPGRKRFDRKAATALISAAATAAILIGQNTKGDGSGADPGLELAAISGKDVMAFTIPAAQPRARIEAAVRRGCTGRQWCQIYGWADPGARASAFPMTDREVAALGIRYALNRATGLDELIWYCGKSRQAGTDCAKSE